MNVNSANRSGNQDIVIVTDYHSKNVEYRWHDCLTGEERRFNRATSFESIRRVLEEACAVACRRGGGVVWIMESTTGWSRVKKLIGDRARFVLVNVLQLPRTPKAYRRKTDALDTAGLLRSSAAADVGTCRRRISRGIGCVSTGGSWRCVRTWCVGGRACGTG
jgi:hypothetical protein